MLFVSGIASVGLTFLKVVIYIHSCKINSKKGKIISAITGAFAACLIFYSLFTIILVGGIS
jgi:hypothetical protein